MAVNRKKRTGRRAGSFRTCCGCRKRLLRKDTLRLVRDRNKDGQATGNLLPDLYGKLPGRGVHLCPDLACFHRAAQQALSRAFKAHVRIEDPAKLASIFLQAAYDRIKSLLSTVQRSGWMVAGRTAVRVGLQGKQLALLVLAGDASADLSREMEARASESRIPCFPVFSVEELSKFHRGKPLAILGVKHRGIASRLAEEIQKASTLSESIKRQAKKPQSKLTAKSDRGKMPQQRGARAGSSKNRS